MLQVIRIIAWSALMIGISAADSEAIIVPVVVVLLGAVLLKLAEVLDKEVDE